MDGILGLVGHDIVEIGKEHIAFGKAAFDAGFDLKVDLVLKRAVVRHIFESVFLFIPCVEIEKIEIVAVGCLHDVGSVGFELCVERNGGFVDETSVACRYDGSGVGA